MAKKWSGCGLKFSILLDDVANEIVFIQFKKITNYYFHVSKIILCPSKRGLGYFKHLLELVVEAAKAQGAGFIGLHVEDDDDLALKNYSKFEFEQYAFVPPNILKMRLRM